MKTVKLTKSKLRDAVEKDLFWKESKVVPFSKSKALWLLACDRIDEDDLIALLAYENDTELCCFVFLIPDLVNTSAGIEKVYWSRRWWVADAYKDSILATYLKNEASKAVSNKIIVKFIGQETESYYERQPFFKFGERARYYILFSADTVVLTSKIKLLRYLKYPLQFLEYCSQKMIKFINRNRIKRVTRTLTYFYENDVSDDTWTFLSPFLENDIVPKSKEYISWQLSNSQYTRTPIETNYPVYSLVADAFSNISATTFTVKKEAKIIGFISYLVRENEFIVKYFVSDESNYEYCLSALMHHFFESDTTVIHTENKKLAETILKKYFTLYTDKRDLYSLLNNSLALDENACAINDHDGHFA